MVGRAEQEDRVGGGVRLGGRTGISHLRGEAMLGLIIGRLPRLLDVKLQQVVQMDLVANESSAKPRAGTGARPTRPGPTGADCSPPTNGSAPPTLPGAGGGCFATGNHACDRLPEGPEKPPACGDVSGPGRARTDDSRGVNANLATL